MPDFASDLPFPEIVRDIETQVPESAGAYLVGGAVRDALLGRPIHDIDIALPGDGVAAARRIANALGGACYPLDSDRGVGRVILVRDSARFTIDFAALRGGDIKADLASRDFTINAIAIPLHHWDQPLDPLSGAADLFRRQIRVCSDSSIQADPVRSIRAVRLAAQLDFHMEAMTHELVREGASGLMRVSAERIRDEFFRILSGQKTAAAMRVAHALGILGHIIPEIVGMDGCTQPAPYFYDVWNQTTRTLDVLEELADLLTINIDGDRTASLTMGLARVQLGRFQDPLAERLQRPLADDRPVRGLLFLAALLHDIGKPGCREVGPSGDAHFLGFELLGAESAMHRAQALRLSNDECGFVTGLVRNQLRPVRLQNAGPITRRAIFRYFRAASPVGVEACLLALADTYAMFGPTLPTDLWSDLLQTVRTLWEGYFEHATECIRPALFLTGNDLIREFQMLPGPSIGELLDALCEAQAAGEVNSREEALALISRGLGRVP
jgi:tRNA nucleotidyltransferase/poly(A) polymerase